MSGTWLEHDFSSFTISKPKGAPPNQATETNKAEGNQMPGNVWKFVHFI